MIYYNIYLLNKKKLYNAIMLYSKYLITYYTFLHYKPIKIQNIISL
jgi:hypothetical protein